MKKSILLASVILAFACKKHNEVAPQPPKKPAIMDTCKVKVMDYINHNLPADSCKCIQFTDSPFWDDSGLQPDFY